MNLLRTPYLPEKRVLLAVADLKREDMRIIEPYAAKKLPFGLIKHADLTFCYLGHGVAVCAPEAYEYYSEKLRETGVTLIRGEKSLDMHYPSDAAYNVAIVGQRIFCKVKITDRVLLNTAIKLGYKIIDMNQGYGKCSVCPVNSKSAISADMSFYKAATGEGLDVLLVTNSTIKLPGYKNGFFGGSVYMENENTLAFNGNAESHPDYDKILEFTETRGILIKQTDEPISDFGSFIPLCEE